MLFETQLMVQTWSLKNLKTFIKINRKIFL